MPTAVCELRSDDPAVVRNAQMQLWGWCANDMRAAVAPAVPFLLRVGADPGAHHRARTLLVAAGVARWHNQGVCTRAEMLRFRYCGDVWAFEPSGYLGSWSVRAARDAIAADIDLLVPLLDDPDPDIRTAATYALAAVSEQADDVRTALHARLRAEHDPRTRAGLVLAIAQLAIAHHDAGAMAWTHAHWSDPGSPPEVRISAALGWLCLSDAPVPQELHAVIDELATDEMALLMAPLPWMVDAEDVYGDGLRRSLQTMIHAVAEDRWPPATRTTPNPDHAQQASRGTGPDGGYTDDPPF
ncbi:HEAT repeat domain-containing protein [Yinghuangia soli]|uniref:HEAT repeat domain-containing protein n=1 Tax=Yinghuangia soli TaxID=2908204 RepID=A0AA41U148_9ACTN|nr:HEAT repeat domain-containing protein [Yinghuangia soli]MCF2527132.1 HEAT repeat domain-containing protein [Yinghuangia soli]